MEQDHQRAGKTQLPPGQVTRLHGQKPPFNTIARICNTLLMKKNESAPPPTNVEKPANTVDTTGCDAITTITSSQTDMGVVVGYPRPGYCQRICAGTHTDSTRCTADTSPRYFRRSRIKYRIPPRHDGGADGLVLHFDGKSRLDGCRPRCVSRRRNRC